MTDQAAVQERPHYLRFLPDFLFRQDQGAPSYIGKAWLLSLLPSLAMAVLVGMLASEAAETPKIPVQGSRALVLLIVLGPLLETLILTIMVLPLRRFLGAGPAVVACAILWGVAHSLAAPLWGLIVWWPFLIFSIALLTWRERGLLAAIGIVTTIHGLQNATAAILLLVQGSPV